MKPTVSIIIPVLNRKDLLLRCLESVVKQTYRPLEVIISDNGSTDGTPETAKEWATQHSTPDFNIKIVSESKPGACAARNHGLSCATGDYILHFDSDDTMRPQLTDRAIREFENNPDADIVCWQCEIHLLDGSIKKPPFNPHNALEDHLINCLLRTQGFMIRANLICNVGGWNDTLPGWNDWELGVRLLLENPKIIGINEVLVDIFCQEKSITGTKFSAQPGRWEKSLNTVREDIENSDIKDKNRLLRIVNYREIILAAHYGKEGKKELATTLRQKTLAKLPSGRFQDTLHKVLLNFAYYYTKQGGRGAWRIIRSLM